MAFYSSQYHEVPYGYDSYGGGYDCAPNQSSLSYSTYDYNDEHKFFNYGSSTPYCYNDYGLSSGSTVSYSVSTSSVPKFLQHNPALTQFVVSYSTAEFNEPEFEAYDPTPYAGGCDLEATYGKPLPPSDKTCYQHSSADPGGATLTSAKEEIKVPVAEPKQPQDKTLSPVHEAPVIVSPGEELESEKGGPRKAGDEHYKPWACDGYGLESAFGYCPCACHAHSRGGYHRGESQPNWCANYIFGCSAYPYGQGREFGGNYPNPIFGYEKHYQEQSLQGQVQYEEPSLLNISTNFF